MTERPACETCVYWQPPRRTTDRSYGFPSDDSRTGQCRRNPPMPMLSERGLRAVWPLTFADHWCGEHATSEPAT